MIPRLPARMPGVELSPSGRWLWPHHLRLWARLWSYQRPEEGHPRMRAPGESLPHIRAVEVEPRSRAPQAPETPVQQCSDTIHRMSCVAGLVLHDVWTGVAGKGPSSLCCVIHRLNAPHRENHLRGRTPLAYSPTARVSSIGYTLARGAVREIRVRGRPARVRSSGTCKFQVLS